MDMLRKLGTDLGIDGGPTRGLRGAPSGSGSSRGAPAGSNPLVSGPINLTTPLSGTFLLEDGQALADSIKNQDWLSCGMAAFSTAVDTAAMLSDPIGQLFAMGFGWLLDHVEPLKGWLDDLTGDAGEVAGFAQTWRNIETQLTESGAELERITANNFADMHGEGIDAAIAFHRDLATHLGAAGRWAGAMGTGLEISSTIVQIVHDITRDAIAEVAGAICSYVLEAVFTLGAAIPLIIEQASTKAFAIAARIGRHIDNLKTALKNLRQLLNKLGTMFDELGTAFKGALKGGSDAGSVRVDAIVPGASRIEPKPRPGGATPGSSKPPVSRAEYDEFVDGLTSRDPNYGKPGARDYQRQVAGDHEYKLATRQGEEIWADGLKHDPTKGAVAIEAKFIEQPGRSSIYEGTAPDFIMEKPMNDFRDEIDRYAAVLRDSGNPVSRLEIVTSAEKAQAFLSGRMAAIAEDLFSEFGVKLEYIVRYAP